MADKKKGKSGDKGGAAKAAEKAEAKKPEAAAPEEKNTVSAVDHRETEGDHGHAAHAHGSAHEHKPNIREYMIIFAVLAGLTVLEVAVAQIKIAKVPMIIALVGLALTKAAIVALFYMHLKHETKVLKYTVALPMLAPTLYAFVLISEVMWRLHR